MLGNGSQDRVLAAGKPSFRKVSGFQVLGLGGVLGFQAGGFCVVRHAMRVITLGFCRG